MAQWFLDNWSNNLLIISFTYEFVGNKDYNGSLHENAEMLLECMEEFHAGKADKISGLESRTPNWAKFSQKISSFRISGNAYYEKYLCQNIPFMIYLWSSRRSTLHVQKWWQANGPFYCWAKVSQATVTFKSTHCIMQPKVTA